MEILIEIKLQKLRIFNDELEIICIEIGEFYPNGIILNNSNNLYEIQINQYDSIKLSALNNIERDIIIMSLRVFYGRNIFLKKRKSFVIQNENNNVILRFTFVS